MKEWIAYKKTGIIAEFRYWYPDLLKKEKSLFFPAFI